MPPALPTYQISDLPTLARVTEELRTALRHHLCRAYLCRIYAASRAKAYVESVPGGRLAALAAAGCGSSVAAVGPGQKTSARTSTRAPTACAHRSGFALSLVTDRGGQANPVAAATWLAKHGRVADLTRSGWRLTDNNRGDATVASGQTVLHVIQGSDGTGRWIAVIAAAEVPPTGRDKHRQSRGSSPEALPTGVTPGCAPPPPGRPGYWAGWRDSD